MLPATLQFLVTMIACAINERMQRKLDYTQEEVWVLMEILATITGSGRIHFTADQRRRLAIAGKALRPERTEEVLSDREAWNDIGVVSAVGGAEVRQGYFFIPQLTWPDFTGSR